MNERKEWLRPKTLQVGQKPAVYTEGVTVVSTSGRLKLEQI